MAPRKMTEGEKAILLAIEENKKTIRQLPRANVHMAGLLPKTPQKFQGAVTDPRTGREQKYTKGAE